MENILNVKSKAEGSYYHPTSVTLADGTQILVDWSGRRLLISKDGKNIEFFGQENLITVSENNDEVQQKNKG